MSGNAFWGSFSLLPPEMEAELRVLPQGAITEISGPDGAGKTEAVLRFLAENPVPRVAWIEQDFSVYPCAFPQYGVALDRVFFVDLSPIEQSVRGLTQAGRVRAQRDACAGHGRSSPTSDSSIGLWAAHQVLTSQVFGIVVLNVTVREAVPLRRLQLAAEKNGCVVILLSEKPLSQMMGATWPIHLQLQASRDSASGSVRLSVLKNRGRKTAKTMEGLEWRHQVG